MFADSGGGALRAASPSGGLGHRDATALALGDEVPALLYLAQDAVTLHCLPEAGKEVLGALPVS
jgi:hypothetical protein